jgi:hypothetical protein
VAALQTEYNGAAGPALELVLVTASLPSRLVERLVARALGSSSVSLVLVDTATFAGAPPKAWPELLRLQAAGVPVAVLRRGDDLAERLGATRVAEAARA